MRVSFDFCSRPAMRIAIDVDRAGVRRFHRLLRDWLARRRPDAEVSLNAVVGETPSVGVTLLLALERVTIIGGRETLCDPLPVEDIGAPASGPPDVVLDLSGRDEPAAGSALALRPLYDGAPSEAAMIGALIEARAPLIEIQNLATGQIVCAGAPSLEAADGLTGAIEAVYSRLMILLRQAIEAPEKAAPRGPVEPRFGSTGGLARLGARTQIGQIARRLYHLCCHAPHWRIGWRIHDGPGVLTRGDLGGVRWSVLGDPGGRFFADPFPIERAGRRYVFFEDFDHRRGKGVISAVEFGRHGPVGEIFRVLEEPWHLSYPFLIEAEGELWMAPESSRSGRVTLYRCVDFPRRWERSAALLEGVEAADPTIFEHGGLFYMMSAVREDIGGFSDTLAIHCAPRLTGPWREIAARPVLIDARAARPAGAVTRSSGALWRPVQDCERGYGRALRLARIDRLDPQGFAQTLGPPICSSAIWPGGRVHTLNRTGALEVIDGLSLNPKWALRGLGGLWISPSESARRDDVVSA